MIKLGIDLGITATKIAAIEGTEVAFTEILQGELTPETVEELVRNHGFSASDVEQVQITGVGQDQMNFTICGCKPVCVHEFKANMCGAKFFCNLERFIIVSMGTGTSFVKVEGNEYQHLGGSAMGGGTLAGLSRMIFHGEDPTYICSLAEKGDLGNIDLHLDEVAPVDPAFPLRITASNLRKGDHNTQTEDAALGLLNLVVQNIGVMAHFAGLGFGIRDFVFIGRVTQIPQCTQLMEQVSTLFHCNFIFPELASFGTAIGAALAKSE